MSFTFAIVMLKEERESEYAIVSATVVIKAGEGPQRRLSNVTDTRRKLGQR